MNSICLLSLCLIVFHLNKVRNIISFIYTMEPKILFIFQKNLLNFINFDPPKMNLTVTLELKLNSSQRVPHGGSDRELAFWSEAREFEFRLWQLEKVANKTKVWTHTNRDFTDLGLLQKHKGIGHRRFPTTSIVFTWCLG